MQGTGKAGYRQFCGKQIHHKIGCRIAITPATEVTTAERGESMTKYRYNKISSIRTFAESPAKWFMLDDVRVTRRDMENQRYRDLVDQIKRGHVYSVQRL